MSATTQTATHLELTHTLLNVNSYALHSSRWILLVKNHTLFRP